MDDSGIINEMKQFCSRFKINPIQSADGCISLEEIIAFQKDGLMGKTTEEIEGFIFKTHAFLTVLRSKKSSLVAFQRGLSGLVDKYVHSHLEDVDKYMPYHAKRDAIVSQNPQVSAINDRVISTEMQIEKIGSLPSGIDQTLRSLEQYLRRRHTNG